jgi:hypothetical protein
VCDGNAAAGVRGDTASPRSGKKMLSGAIPPLGGGSFDHARGSPIVTSSAAASAGELLCSSHFWLD